MVHVEVRGGPVNYAKQGMVGPQEGVIAVAKPIITLVVDRGPAVTAIIAA